MKLLENLLIYRECQYSTSQIVALTILRVLVGWHFLYEGVIKFADPGWSSASYLASARGPMAVIFQKAAMFPPLLQLVDFLNVWGLIVVGLCLILGVFSIIAYFLGICLLVLYYISMPPLIGYTYSNGVEGAYLLVNKNLIEISALFVLWFFPTGNQTGLDFFINRMSVKGER